MKTIYTLVLVLVAGTAFSQVPTNFGSNAEDGFTFVGYNLIDHGVVSSVRFMAQNSMTEGDATWEFYAGDFLNNWRPYTPDDTLSGYNAIIDPAVETASARYNSNNGGSTGKLPAVQAGYYYTVIVQDGTGDNLMSIIETDFSPVILDDVTHSPADPLETDGITITVDLNSSLVLSPGEHVFVRASVDGWATSSFTEVTNFSNGVGSIFIPGGTIPAGVTVDYYALVTAESAPVHETIDYFTLFFGNNGGTNYSFTVSSVIGIEDMITEYGITQSQKVITVNNTQDITTLELVSLDGKVVVTQQVNSATANLSTSELSKGVYILNLRGSINNSSTKLLVN